MSLGRSVERAAWIVGAALLLVYGGSRLWSETSRVRGLEVLRQSQSASFETIAQTSTPGRQVTSAETVDASTSAAPAASVESTVASAAALHSQADQTLWSNERVLAFAESLRRPGVPEGALLIPSLDLEVPVYAGATDLNLNRGAAWIDGTAPLTSPGNVGIAAHRDGFFRGLKDIAMDAEVIVEGASGSMRYRVVEISIVQPTDVHVLAPTAVPSVTLVTCYPFYFVGNAPERYIVRAELVDSGGFVAREIDLDDERAHFGPITTTH